MNEILSVGLILVAALIAGHLAQLAHVPEVSGYLLIGLLIGPAGLDLISHDNLVALGFLSEVALGLILFNIGAIFERSILMRLGRDALAITLWEATLTFALVLLALLAVGVLPAMAVLLAVVAMETAPATTLMVLHEYDARGPMSDRLVALVAMNNMYVLLAFGAVTAVLGFLTGPSESLLGDAYRAAHGLGWTVFGSFSLGVLLGILTDAWASRATEGGEAMILSAGIVLIAVGASRWLGLSPLMTTLALGATVVNASPHGDRLLNALGTADPPLYAVFFVLAGAELVPASLSQIGVAGVIYAVARAAGKIAGARIATRHLALTPVARQQLGFCLVSSSSLAVGLTVQIRATFPAYAATVTGVVLAAVLMFEIIGPILTRRALVLTGEATLMPSPLVPSGEASS